MLIGVGALGWAVHHTTVASGLLDGHTTGARLDASSLICGAALLAGMLLLLRGLRHDLLLDGLLAGTASIAVIATLAQPGLHSVAPSVTAPSPDLSLPMLDLLMLMVAITAAVISGWRQARAWLLLALALLMLTTADTLALYESVVASGAGRSAMNVLWPASIIALAIAAWQSADIRPQPSGDRSSAVAVPASAVSRLSIRPRRGRGVATPAPPRRQPVRSARRRRLHRRHRRLAATAIAARGRGDLGPAGPHPAGGVRRGLTPAADPRSAGRRALP